VSKLSGTSPRGSFRDRPSRPTAGFTLLETGLALLALGLIAYIATAQLRKYQHRAHRDQFIADLRTLATAFQTFHIQTGDWPAATNPDAPMPHGLETVLASTAWLTGPPFGGAYAWTPPGRTITDKDPGKDLSQKEAVPKADEKEPAKTPPPAGAIVVTAFSPGPPLALTDDDLRYIDAKLDDGNLATGRFRTGFNRWPVYSVAPRP
jgi:type II secretory pathway pseudopilin PulG